MVMRSGFWIYLASLANTALGFVFWLVISSITGPSTVGNVSAVTSLAILLSSMFSMGLPVGMIKWIGQYREAMDEVRGYFWTSLISLLLLYSLPSSLLASASALGLRFSNYGPSELMMVSILLVPTISSLYISLFTGLLDTFPYFLSIVAGSVLKLITGVYLVSRGYGWMGAAVGYLMLNLTLDIAGSLYAIRKVGYPKISLVYLRNCLKAGIPSWLPNMILIVGQQFAVILLFGYSGAYTSGLFYIAMVLSGFIVGVGSSILSAMLPYLSGSEEKEEAAFRSLRISLALTLPLVGAILIFPDRVLSLLGSSYSLAWPELVILTISNTLSLAVSTVVNLLYSRDMFTKVLGLGLSTSVPRLVSYVLLAPVMGSLGMAISYFLGSAFGLLAAFIMTLPMEFDLLGRFADPKALKGLTILVLLGAVAMPFRATPFWEAGAIIYLILSILALMRARIIEKNDLYDLGRALLPERYRDTAYATVKPFIDIIYS